MNYGFIGFGNLAKAIYTGLKDNDALAFAYLSKTSRHPNIQAFDKLSDLVDFADVLWLCVKPQQLHEVLPELKKLDLRGKALVSPVAGKNLDFLQKELGQEVTLMRIMPNLAIATKESVTAFVSLQNQSPLVEAVKMDLMELGTVLDIEEKDFDCFTVLFGSGPAFLLKVLQGFEHKLTELKFPKEENTKLLQQLLKGTLSYLETNQAEQSLETMIQNIASKGGVTEAGLKVIPKNMMTDVFEAAQKRSEELGEA